MAVAVVVATQTAHLASTQHTAWMLINQLARATGVVSAVRVVCPPGVRLSGRIVPLAPRELPLCDALVRGGQAIGATPVLAAAASDAADVVLIVGAQRDERDCGQHVRHVNAHGWWGGVSEHPMPSDSTKCDLPYGPYIAASLAAGEIFLNARLPQHVPRSGGTYGWDSWTQALRSTPTPGAPEVLNNLDLTGTSLAGVGAVGSTWVHALWATNGLTGQVALADADPKGVTTTNLNRCPLFGTESLNTAKAIEAARLASDSPIDWAPHHGRHEEAGNTPTLLVSAVDTNRAREALQHGYPPRILSGSTLDLRAEVLRAGPPAVGACLRCYNPPEAFVGDDELRAATRDAGPEAVEALAAETGVTPAGIQRWLERGGCDEVGTRLLNTLRSRASEPPARFAVGFTSVMAGTMLTAETVKTLLSTPLTNPPSTANNATFQFLRPTSAINAAGTLAPDPNCPACAITNPATQIWEQRLTHVSGPAG